VKSEPLGPVERREVEVFVRLHLRSLTRLATALVGDRVHAEDFVSNTITQVVSRWRNISASDFGYARQTMINIYLNNAQRGAGLHESLSASSSEQPSSDGSDFTADRAVDRTYVAQALDMLEPDFRAVVTLRFLEDLSAVQVGYLLNRPAGTVRRMTHQALRTLRSASVLDTAARRPYRAPSPKEQTG
jgi:RNA polymerase sigma factor (sigma-70 family)